MRTICSISPYIISTQQYLRYIQYLNDTGSKKGGRESLTVALLIHHIGLTILTNQASIAGPVGERDRIRTQDVGNAEAKRTPTANGHEPCLFSPPIDVYSFYPVYLIYRPLGDSRGAGYSRLTGAIPGNSHGITIRGGIPPNFSGGPPADSSLPGMPLLGLPGKFLGKCAKGVSWKLKSPGEVGTFRDGRLAIRMLLM